MSPNSLGHGNDQGGPSPEGTSRRIRTLFDQALELSPGDRDRFLHEECADDEERSRVLRLLARDATGGEIPFKTPDFEAMWQGSLTGRRLGPYRILEEIGRGGMSRVYAAQRTDDEYDAEVAVKILPPWLDSPDIRARLRAERQILADLDHPRIARLLDGGSLPAGTPYLVMERIHGETLTSFCTSRALDVRARIRLFLQVAEAIGYAHRRLVLHRDLKPSNILVTEQPELEVKVLDFGIATVLEAEEKTVSGTRTRILTPDYASPEQLRGDRVGTSSDLFSLGVVLYELLAGQLPHTRGVSSAAGSSDDSPLPPSIASARSGKPESVAVPPRELKGDLDAICLRALRPDPEERYRTVDDLAEDLRRHLDGLPVEARRVETGYHLLRTARRHLGALITIGVLLVTTAAALRFHTLQLTAERDLAQQERIRAEKVTSFLVESLRNADPQRRREGRDVTVGEMLQAAAERVHEEFPQDSEQRGLLFHTFGYVFRELGDLERARTFLEEALAIRRSEHPNDHRALGETSLQLAQIAFQDGELDPADAYVGDALRAFRDDPEARLLFADALDLQAGIRYTAGAPEAAETLLREELRIRRVELPEDHPSILGARSNLAHILQSRDDYAAARTLHLQNLERERAQFGERHVLVADSLLDLALVHQHLGEWKEAEASYRAGIAMVLDQLGADQVNLIRHRAQLGRVLTAQGRLDLATEEIDAARKLALRLDQENHLHAGWAWLALAGLQIERGEHAEAAESLNQSDRIWSAGLSPEHPRLAWVSEQRGRSSRARGFHREALDHSDTALRLLGATPTGRADLNQSSVLVHRTRSLLALGDLVEAHRSAERALEARVAILGEGHGWVDESRCLLGEVASRLGHGTSETENRDSCRRAVAFLGSTLEGRETKVILDEADEKPSTARFPEGSLR